MVEATGCDVGADVGCRAASLPESEIRDPDPLRRHFSKCGTEIWAFEICSVSFDKSSS